MAKNIAILGSTGSIGTQTLDVVRNLHSINVCVLTTNQNIELLERQIIEFSPQLVCIMNTEKGNELRAKLNNPNLEIVTGLEGLIKAAIFDCVDTVVTAVSGNIGIKPTFEAIRAGKDIALANKETLIAAGGIIIQLAKDYGVHIYPVDSEHSAIYQCLQGSAENKISRILLTASGGPFRGRTKQGLEKVTVAEALNHPVWSMGKKNTIDSATLMNKGLEMIEAKWLFDVDVSQIEVLIHPQSIIHSAVEFEDNAIIAQLSEPDMRLPIQYALTYPQRVKSPCKKIDFTFQDYLSFEKPDLETFRCLKLAYFAIEVGGTMPAVLNAANEVAIERFLVGDITFLEIPDLIEQTMNAHKSKLHYNLDDLLEADNWAKAFARKLEI
jgi:1-deoxy-D-xylulose-5-phosphate reductoisomerase